MHLPKKNHKNSSLESGDMAYYRGLQSFPIQKYPTENFKGFNGGFS